MLVREVIQKTTHFLQEKGSSSSRLDAELLISHALGWRRLDVFLKFDYPLKEEELVRCREFVRRRSLGEPVAYIIENKDFYKNTFKVRPGILIPRPETELIVEKALNFLSPLAKTMTSLTILDFGCGSGCLGLSIIGEITNSRLLGFDVSQRAIEVSNENATLLKLGERAQFFQQDLFSLDTEDLLKKLGEPPALIVANPPYIDAKDLAVEINVVKFEPREALFSEDNGLKHIGGWLQKAKDMKTQRYFSEIGSDQAAAAVTLAKKIESQGQIAVFKDLAGHDRILSVDFSS